MLRSAVDFIGYKLHAIDGDIGTCDDFLFDDTRWTVRYMVADTGGWLRDKRVLISPIALGPSNWASRKLSVALQIRQIEESPPLGHDEPVSRTFEKRYMRHYGFQPYWHGGNLWGLTEQPRRFPSGEEHMPEPETIADRREPDYHLRSCAEVKGYHLHATDGDLGAVHDFIVDDNSWTIEFVVVSARRWLPGKKVLLAPSWIESVDWFRETISVDHSVEEIKNAPPFDPTEPVNRAYKLRLYDYYGRPQPNPW